MNDSFYIAAIGMNAQQSQLDAVSQNVANLNTVGFRREVIAFSSLTAADLAPGSVRAGAGDLLERGAGVQTALHYDMTAGALQTTGNALDVAINGVGFIEVTRSDGTPAYTRGGSLMVDSQGMLAVRTGEELAAKIAVPPDAQSVTIQSDGQVYALVGGSATPTSIGRIELVSFQSPESLQATGDSLFVADSNSGDPRQGQAGANGLGTLIAGSLEGSNVDMSTEMVTMLLAQRGFELNSRIVQSSDQMLSLVNALVR